MRVPGEEIERRVAAFQAALAADSIDVALIVEAADVVYLAGCVADAHLVVPAHGEALFLVRRDLERARAASPLPRIEPLVSLRALPDAVRSVVAEPARLGLELDVLPAAQYLRYARAFGDLELCDASALLRSVRARKSEWELDQIREAGRQIAVAQAAALTLIRDGMTDRALQIELERALRLAGHEGPMRFRGMNGEIFYGAVLAGPDAAIPAHADTPLGGPGPSPAVGRGPRGGAIGPGVAVTVDLCGASAGYIADATRTISLGPLVDPLEPALAVCTSILAEIETLLVPGTPWRTPYERGLELAAAAGFGDGFMGAGRSRVRFVGHGVGLEINEPPFLAAGLDERLEAGHVVAVEPKLVFPGIGAVGVENTYLVRETGGPENLTPF